MSTHDDKRLTASSCSHHPLPISNLIYVLQTLVDLMHNVGQPEAAGATYRRYKGHRTLAIETRKECWVRVVRHYRFSKAGVGGICICTIGTRETSRF